MIEALEGYSDQELELRVYNVERLYNRRLDDDFIDQLREEFTFTKQQQIELEKQLAEDREEC